MATKAKPDPEDPREKFRQALEAKKSRGGHAGRGPEGGGSTGKGHSTPAGGGKREFRRKSGG